jgi:hypothetical protein
MRIIMIKTMGIIMTSTKTCSRQDPILATALKTNYVIIVKILSVINFQTLHSLNSNDNLMSNLRLVRLRGLARMSATEQSASRAVQD